ncbi:MAG: hypothetical protein NUV74_02410 [Candidatus Brocadiaceae bacterium]|nr:hypothetical protein [Candidatus Brocadiaceae bacterium]
MQEDLAEGFVPYHGSPVGHLVIKLCTHPPFTAQIMLNGHEYVAIQARKENISFTKEGNCFTHVGNATGLARVADTMRASCSAGRLVQVCERWIYSACLCFALDSAEQEKSEFRYSYSVYQVEYSRNLLFTRGHTLDQVFHGVIDRTRALLNIKTVKTIFGYKHRPFKKNAVGEGTRCEVVVERPDYDLTVFKIHCGKLTVKIYSKGELVLRIEAVAHNTKELRCGKVREIMKDSDSKYQSRQASYDLKKFRGKDLVYRVEHSRCYQVTKNGLRMITAYIVLREKTLMPLLACAGKRKTGPKPPNCSQNFN